MSEPRYRSLEVRSTELLERGASAWREVQRFALEQEEVVDAVALLGQELWLPHHEADGRLFSVTLRLSVRLPHARRQEASERFLAWLEALEQRLSDDQGALRVAAEFG